MPKKLQQNRPVPTPVSQRLTMWGRAIRTQRVLRCVPADHLCARMDISDTTLRHIERGDPGVNVTAYLTALRVMGILDTAVPLIDPAYWNAGPASRARQLQDDEDGYF